MSRLRGGLPKRMKLQWKVFCYFLFFCALLLVLLWLMQTVFLDATYKAIKSNSIRNAANLVAENIDEENLEALTEQIAQANNYCILIVDQTGQTLLNQESVRGCVLHTMHEKGLSELYARAMQTGDGLYSAQERGSQEKETSIEALDAGGEVRRIFRYRPLDSLVYGKLVTNAQGEELLVLLSAVISPLNATVSTLRVQLVVISALMLLLSVGLAFLLARGLSKPIVNIERKAAKLAGGDFSVHFADGGCRELSSLSETLNQTARELGKAEDLRRELLANVSHDLRTPLTLIGGYAEAMRDLPEENTPENAQIIMEEAARLSVLVADLMDLSKLEAGVEQPDMRPVELCHSLETTAARIGELLKADGYRIEFSGEEAYVLADETRITQAVYNLLLNAVDHAGEDRRVQLRLTKSENYAHIEVLDGGTGIAPEQMEHIWERYYRGGEAHKRSVRGSGLGLSIVKSIASTHAGLCGVRNRPEGGSCFYLQLPLWTGAEDGQGTDAQAQRQRKN